MTIKPIETRYKSYRFRSRLEARWAVFFDSLGVPWEYEPQGFIIGGVPYLPDFWLPRQQTWLEVKGTQYSTRHPSPWMDTPDDWALCAGLARESGFKVFMVFGDLCPLGFAFRSPNEIDPEDIVGSNRGWYPGTGRWIDGCCTWGQCPLCGAVGIDHCGQHDGCVCVCNGSFSRRPDRHHNDLYCAVCDRHAWKG